MTEKFSKIEEERKMKQEQEKKNRLQEKPKKEKLYYTIMKDEHKRK